ncbi:hypothetical protein H632_c4509p0, partial [Helicosporidium sp. ATCC 50920]
VSRRHGAADHGLGVRGGALPAEPARGQGLGAGQGARLLPGRARAPALHGLLARVLRADGAPAGSHAGRALLLPPAPRLAAPGHGGRQSLPVGLRRHRASGHRPLAQGGGRSHGRRGHDAPRLAPDRARGQG